MPPRRRAKPSDHRNLAASVAAATGAASSLMKMEPTLDGGDELSNIDMATDHHGKGSKSNPHHGGTAVSTTVVSSSSNSCLHCHEQAFGVGDANIQVRCDECNAYICNACHWCHEFQANHEIRVCDRCDAFYCKGCDEMDQCDDCGEVVCGSCSTLLSCKFCGGGLCEDCATACGRCGIVLCSRDAKFAVDCDTCRLSYCLVCLASSSKDPCVRCGHRPSKRMEQLVHLRLKSIYKAFKQSSSNPGSSNNNSSNSGSNGGTDLDKINSNSQPTSKTSSSRDSSSGRRGGDGGLDQRTTDEKNRHDFADQFHRGGFDGDPSSIPLFQASGNIGSNGGVSAMDPSFQQPLNSSNNKSGMSSNFKKPGSSTNSRSNNHSGTHSKHEVLAAAAAANTEGSSTASTCPRNSSLPPGVPITTESLELAYKREKAKADAAAAALLEELAQEEAAASNKKSKKKRKKERQLAKKQQEAEAAAAAAAEAQAEAGPVARADEEEQMVTTAFAAASEELDDKVAEGSAEVATDSSTTTLKAENRSPSHATRSRERDPKSASEKSEKLSDGSGSTGREEQEKTESSDHGKYEDDRNDGTNGKAPPHGEDPLEVELRTLVESSDLQGLERLLDSVRGVPGHAMLRKNTKKAIKRLKLTLPPPEQPSAEIPDDQVKMGPESDGNDLRDTITTKKELLVVVSRENEAPESADCPVDKAGEGGEARDHTECVLRVCASVSSWVCQSVRDVMTESGARIMIDQDSMGPGDPKAVYVSGCQQSVDRAVQIMRELVSRAAEVTGSAQSLHPVISPDLESHGYQGSNLATGDEVMAASATGSPRDGSAGSRPRTEHVMTCDPRFVPLLIGRRGWAIKNIQDSSGARVDIDQTVNPRKITISGREGQVQVAVRMVSDVLSYPHEQLHGGDHPSTANVNGLKESVDNVRCEHGANPHMLTPGLVPGAPDECAQHSPLHSNVAKTSHSSPPSSLIMAADAKSTISASSSLSSTPEPSMASMSAKAEFQHSALGSMLPPVFGMAQQFSPTEPRRNGYARGPPQNLVTGAVPVSAAGMFASSNGPVHGPETSFYLAQTKTAAAQQHSPMQQRMHLVPSQDHQRSIMGGRPHQPYHLGLQDGSGGYASQQRSAGGFRPLSGAQPLPVNRRSAFHPSQPTFHQLQGQGGDLEQPLLIETSAGPAPKPVSWQQHSIRDGAPLPSQLQRSSTSDAFRHAAAVDFLQHSSHAPDASIPLSGGVSEAIGLPVAPPTVLERRASAPTGTGLGRPAPDESLIVDSLFAPAHAASSDSTLLTGLQRLSVGKDPIGSSNLWGSSGIGVDVLSGLPPLGSGPDVAKNASHFYGSTSALGTEQHPAQSRFAWGGFSDHQQSM